MDKRELFYASILMIGVLISSVSQVMLKKAAMKTYSSPIREYLNPLVVFAYVLFLGTTVLSVLSYRGIPLSMGPILEATSYLYVTIFGAVIFKEKMNRKKIFALLLIIAGILIYSLMG